MRMPKINKNKSGYYFRARFTDINGNKHQVYKSGFKRKGDAVACYNQLYTEFQQVTEDEPMLVLFKNHILTWFNTVYRGNVSVTTAENRWYSIKKHILPYFGSTPVDKITTSMLNQFYRDKLDENLKEKTVRELHTLIKQAFDQALIDKIAKENPSVLAKPPIPQSVEIQPWTKEQAKQFLKVVEGTSDEAVYVVAIFTGMRKGEILGLKWDDIDLERGKVHVRRSVARIKGSGLILKNVKTKKSKRQISISPYVVNVLKKHYLKQQDWIERLNEEYNDRGMVFCAENGNLKDPNNLLREFNRYVRLAGIRKVRIHDLRHLHATLLLENGENPKVVQERLGHNDVEVTLGIYSHVTDDLQDEAARRLEESFFG
ncbi:tyrosine-type recombinase/integrase [Peribacillus frigoritolerans]|uniref:tyrosine-type recombinase/integrase n=1 Tax=Peribacillus frigoritolerans TaxID=450367 RepID=UPI0037F40C57